MQRDEKEEDCDRGAVPEAPVLASAEILSWHGSAPPWRDDARLGCVCVGLWLEAQGVPLARGAISYPVLVPVF